MSVGPTQKQDASIYTVLLFISLICMTIAVIAMWIELGKYGDDRWNTNAGRPSVGMIAPFLY